MTVESNRCHDAEKSSIKTRGKTTDYRLFSCIVQYDEQTSRLTSNDQRWQHPSNPE
jgi:hypothetical protein